MSQSLDNVDFRYVDYTRDVDILTKHQRAKISYSQSASSHCCQPVSQRGVDRVKKDEVIKQFSHVTVTELSLRSLTGRQVLTAVLLCAY